jgi:hypothetical protein
VNIRSLRLGILSALGFLAAFIVPIFVPGSFYSRVFAWALCGLMSANPMMHELALAKFSGQFSGRAVAADIPDLVAQRSSEFDDAPMSVTNPSSNTPNSGQSSSMASQRGVDISGKWQFDFGWFVFDPSDVDGSCRVASEAGPYKGEVSITQNGENISVSAPPEVPMSQGKIVGSDFTSSGEAPIRWQGNLSPDGMKISGVGTCGKVSQPFTLTRAKKCRKSQVMSIDQAIGSQSSNTSVPAFPGQVAPHTPIRAELLGDSEPSSFNSESNTSSQLENIAPNVFKATLKSQKGSKAEIIFELSGSKSTYRSAQLVIPGFCEDITYSYQFSDENKKIKMTNSQSKEIVLVEKINASTGMISFNGQAGKKSYEFDISGSVDKSAYKTKYDSSSTFAASKTKGLIERYTEFDNPDAATRTACGALQGLCDVLPLAQGVTVFMAGATVASGGVLAVPTVGMAGLTFIASWSCFAIHGGLPPLIPFMNSGGTAGIVEATGEAVVKAQVLSRATPAIKGITEITKGLSKFDDVMGTFSTITDVSMSAANTSLDARDLLNHAGSWGKETLKFLKSICHRPEQEADQPQPVTEAQQPPIKVTVVGPTRITKGQSTTARVEFKAAECNATEVTFGNVNAGLKTIKVPEGLKCGGSFDFQLFPDESGITLGCKEYSNSLTAYVPGVQIGNSKMAVDITVYSDKENSSPWPCYVKDIQAKGVANK